MSGQPMSGAELQTIREYLGLTGDRLARLLDVSPRTVRSWEAGTYPIPDGVRADVADLERETALAVDTLVAALRSDQTMVIAVWRTDDAFAAGWAQGTEYGARWRRHVAARAAAEVPGRAIVQA